MSAGQAVVAEVETPRDQEDSTAQHAVNVGREAPARRDSAADRFMRSLLRVKTRDRSVESERIAHRGFRLSMVISGVRCLITYLLIPILVPIISFADVVAAPIGLALCAVAFVSGIVSLRRFWISDHRSKWMYTAFIAVVFVILAIAVVFDISKIVSSI